MPIENDKKTGDITNIGGLVWGITARNGANRKIPARICADTDEKKNRFVKSLVYSV